MASSLQDQGGLRVLSAIVGYAVDGCPVCLAPADQPHEPWCQLFMRGEDSYDQLSLDV